MKLSLLFLLSAVFAFGQDLSSTSIYFDVDQYHSSQLSQQAPEAMFEKIARNAKIIRIEAYCDSTGSNAYNLQLANKRLKTVQEYLKALPYNMNSTELKAIGESSEKNAGLPLSKCRRVDIYFIEPNIQSNPQPVSSPPTTVLKDTVARTMAPQAQDFSKSAVDKFANDASSSELQLDMSILFMNASDKVLVESVPQLKELLKLMEKYPEMHAHFHGHVCCSYNMEISEARARTVYLYLIANGIDAERLSYEGHSNTQPKVWPEVTDDDRKLNRRVSVVFKK